MKRETKVRENATALLSSFQLCLDFLSRVFLDAPDEKLISRIVRAEIFVEYPVPENPSIEEGLRILRLFSQEWQSCLMEALKLDYLKLFVGTEKMLAPPYASVHLSEERILLEKHALEAREFYRKYDLQVPVEPGIPDDFIGYELYFLSFLCHKAAEDIRVSKISDNNAIFSEMKIFLDDHLLLWLDSFVSNVRQKAATSYYRGLAYLLQGTVAKLCEFLPIWSGE